MLLTLLHDYINLNDGIVDLLRKGNACATMDEDAVPNYESTSGEGEAEGTVWEVETAPSLRQEVVDPHLAQHLQTRRQLDVSTDDVDVTCDADNPMTAATRYHIATTTDGTDLFTSHGAIHENDWIE